MAYTVKQVAQMSGISVRTLHYYDEIGLLKPTYVGENGYRFYERGELLRLQQIMFYREMNMPLGEIASTLDDPAFDKVAALESHRNRLEQDIARRYDLIRTINNTLIELRGETEMENPFTGFTPEKQEAYEKELVDQYGKHAREHIAESKRRVGEMSAADMDAVKEEGHQINLDLVALIIAGDTIDSDAVQKVIARHYAWVSNFWIPSAEAYAGLGRNYCTYPDFRAFYDKYDPRLAEFLADAMALYAKAALE